MAHKPKKGQDKKVVFEPFITNSKILANFEFDLKSPDKVLEHEGFEYYDKMLDTDAHVYSVINTRKLGAASIPFLIVPKDDSPDAITQARFIEFLLGEIDIENHFFDILDAIPKGFSMHEIIAIPSTLNNEFKDKIIINRLIQYPQHIFTFKANKKTGFDMYYKPTTFGEEKRLPANKILHAHFDSSSPYGKPLLEKLYWYYWFKKETGFKFWAIFLEKFGGPTAVMKFPSGDTSTALQTAANTALDELQNSTGISIPDTFDLDFAKVSQGDVSYPTMIDACNAEMSKAVLGATQTVEEGRRGSYALSRTHTDVRTEYKLHDTRVLRRAIQGQIINRFIHLNYANPLPPSIKFELPKLPVESAIQGER
jgi:phage gp29-like protein